MSLAEIEAELEKLTPEELCHLALRAWRHFVEKEGREPAHPECSEEDPALLAALDEALERANQTPSARYSGDEVRDRLRQWTSSK
jgi:hypothetical protein